MEQGGRPVYPISLLDEISTNPHEYHDLLQPWLEYPDVLEAHNWMTIFQQQLTSWEYFLAWRNERRGIYDYDAEYSLYVERMKRGYALYRLTQDLAELEADRSSDKKGFDLYEQRRRGEQYGLPELGDGGGFPAYAEAVAKRLAEDGFTQTFQLDPDPAQQDKLTTWIEYLCYGYCWRDRCIGNLRDLQPEYDDAWKQLVDSGVLKSGETEERLRTTESAMGRQREVDAAAKEVELARSAARAVLAAKDQAMKDPGSSNLTPQACVRMIDKAHARLNKATAALKRVKRRGNLVTDFIRATFGHKRARRNLEHHGLLVRWMLEQIPLIEAETSKPRTSGGRSQAGRGTKRRHGRDGGDEPTDDRAPTGEQGGGHIPDGRRPAKQARRQGPPARGMSAAGTQRSPASVEGPPSPLTAAPRQLRHSPRIAALQGSSGTIEAPPQIVKKLRQRKAPPASSPPPRTQVRQPRALSTGVSRGKATTGADRGSKSKPKGVTKRRRPRR